MGARPSNTQEAVTKKPDRPPAAPMLWRALGSQGKMSDMAWRGKQLICTYAISDLRSLHLSHLQQEWPRLRMLRGIRSPAQRCGAHTHSMAPCVLARPSRGHKGGRVRAHVAGVGFACKSALSCMPVSPLSALTQAAGGAPCSTAPGGRMACPQAASMEGRLKLRRMPRARTSACEQPSGARLPELLRCAAGLPDAQYAAQSSRGASSTCTDSTCRARRNG